MRKLLNSRWWVGDLTANIPGNLVIIFKKVWNSHPSEELRFTSNEKH